MTYFARRFLAFTIASVATLSGCGGGDSSAPAPDGGVGSGGAPGGSTPSGGKVPATVNNKDKYDFGTAGGKELYVAAKGVYKLDCVAARGPNAKVGVGYFVVKEEGTLTALNSDGVEVLTIAPANVGGGAALQAGNLVILSVAGRDGTAVSLNFDKATGDLNGNALLVGQNGMKCFSLLGRTLKYGAAVPSEFGMVAGTHKMQSGIKGENKYDLAITADGKVTVTETAPMSGMVRWMGDWKGGIVPVFVQAGDFVLYLPGSTTSFGVQLGASSGTEGAEFSWNVDRITYFGRGGLVMNGVPK